MASGTPMLNGDLTRGPLNGTGPSQMASLEETIQQMNILIKENQELKEALKQTNTSMKERFEGLSAWKEKQKEERDFLEGRLEEAKQRMSILSTENESLKKRFGILSEAGTPGGELETLRAHVARLQAEKNDLVALNSELQLKMGQGSPEDSFIEIRFAEGEVEKDLPCLQKDLSASQMPRMESEEQTVSQLLQSLRKETERGERLEQELSGVRERLKYLELQVQEKDMISENGTQTSLSHQMQESVVDKQSSTDKSNSEVENLKAQMKTLFSELQQAQKKLDEAENMKKNLQDRSRDMEQELGTLRVQLGERQQVQSENEKLKLQLESLQAEKMMEQKKAQEEKGSLAQLKDAYTKLFEDYNEIKEERRKRDVAMASLSRDERNELQSRLVMAEQALAAKQQHIDEMKQEIFQKEKELETISVFKAQAEVYSSDFYAERAAREKIHEEKERLAAQLEFVKKQNSQLQEDMESLGRHSLSEMQRRHVSRGATPQGGATSQSYQGNRGVDINIPEHACPKCNEVLPDLDSLQIHIMDCII
ncbi:optineurin isoform X2 [Denticeps clupeoides]|uniref:optineurin isoform X2 n=1 Tax=Denticeps clupeoides TaxID=299321 RepID=UPI0010A4EFE3|nr:optineurin isoform X2 [Denticeps clupeoides]